MTKQELLQRKHQLEKDISKYKNLQLAKKVQLNSAYGAIGNQYFRFFDVRMAESITLSGQLSIRWIEARMNEYLNKLLQTEDEDYVIASDTDSLYISFDRLVDRVFKKGDELHHLDTDRVVKFLDHIAEKKIEPFIDKSYQDLADLMNAYAQKMFMKREVIADKGIWTAKKRYILNVHNSEGVRYAEPKLKMMGIEAVKSSTPTACRERLKETLKLIMNSDEKTVQKYIADFKKEFCQMPFEDVAFPRTVSDLTGYVKKAKTEDKLIPGGCPIHVRGAIMYNEMLKSNNLTKTFEMIKDGEKIKFCYLKMPNPSGTNVMSIISTLPRKFALSKYIDYELQFQKAFLEPIQIILESIDWNAEPKATLEEFFV